MNEELTTFRTYTYVGGYQVGGPIGMTINLTVKPRWLHRTMMRWCFGWVWVDA